MKIQPLGPIRGLEADASCRWEEDEKEEAVWLREQGHCKSKFSLGSSIPGLRHWLQQQQGREAAKGVGEAQESRRSVFMAGERLV